MDQALISPTLLFLQPRMLKQQFPNQENLHSMALVLENYIFQFSLCLEHCYCSISSNEKERVRQTVRKLEASRKGEEKALATSPLSTN